MRLQRYGADGRRRIIGIATPGEVIGARPLNRSGYSLEAATDVELCTFDRRSFERLVEGSPDLRRALLQQRVADLDRLRWLTWALGALRPEERIAALYGMAPDVMPTQAQPDGSAIVTVELSRADIADLLGTTPETISRVTHRLAAEGEIEIMGPRHVHIRNPRALAERGCDIGAFNLFSAVRAMRSARARPEEVAKKVPQVRAALTPVIAEGAPVE
jgi:CRP/FNR family transcriptional regulator